MRKNWLEYLAIYLIACGIGVNVVVILYFFGVIN